MINIKEYVKNNIKNDPISLAFGVHIGIIELVEIDEDDKEYHISSAPASLTIKNTENKTEQEILKGLANSMLFVEYTCHNKSVPDNIRVYLHINEKRYLIMNEYRPDLYY